MTQQPEQQKPGLYIPLWIALAGMILAFIVAIVIMANVLEPLVNLVFPSNPEVAVPSESVELENVENPATSKGEWLYGSDMDGCEVAQFYIDQGSTCNFAPLACDETVQDASSNLEASQSVFNIATCEGTNAGIVDSYSWEVLISSGYSDYRTKFRVFLYTER